MCRRFGDADAVRGVSFQIARGEVVGFLGHNGAGKSTTLRMLGGVVAPSAGMALVEGRPACSREARARVGFLPETPPLTAELTVAEQLTFAAGLRGAPADDVERVLDRCDLHPQRRQLVRTLSRGIRQRVGLAQALLGDPPVLLLDEPTAGLDPTQAARTRDLIRELGTTHAVLLSSHLLGEVQAVCSRVLLLRRGELVLDTTLAALAQRGSSLETIALRALEG